MVRSLRESHQTVFRYIENSFRRELKVFQRNRKRFGENRETEKVLEGIK
jgi:hypothetical protein